MAGGRTSKFNKTTLDRLFAAIRAGLPYHLAADAAGISQTTFYEWQAGKFPRGASKQLKAEFSEELTRARGGSAARLITIINQAAPEDWRAAAWILERRFPRDFGKQTLEITGEGGGPMQVEMSTLQRIALKALEDDPDARVKVAQALVEADSHARIA